MPITFTKNPPHAPQFLLRMAKSLSQTPLRPSCAFVQPPKHSQLHNPSLSFTTKPKRILLHISKPNILISTHKNGRLRASPDSESNGSTQQSEATNTDPQSSADEEASRLGSQIRQAMAETEQRKDFWSGVAEEIVEIEWPPFNKVVGTTGVVLGVIAGSTVVLLTVNAVFAELSDTVFAGKGVQDFFGSSG